MLNLNVFCCQTLPTDVFWVPLSLTLSIFGGLFYGQIRVCLSNQELSTTKKRISRWTAGNGKNRKIENRGQSRTLPNFVRTK